MENETSHKARPLEVFLGICSLALTVVVAFATGGLFFSLIDHSVADPLARFSPSINADSIRYAIAVLVITFPLLLASRHYLKRLADARGWTLRSKLYDSATYLILFASGGTVIGDLIAVVFNFLRGEATGRFLLKALVVFVIATLVFEYYLVDRRRRELDWKEPKSLVKWIEGITVLLVVVSIVAGFVIAGGPGSARLERFDEVRVEDLNDIEQSINWYSETFGFLPNTIDDVKEAAQTRAPSFADFRDEDPETGEQYGYNPIASTPSGTNEVTYELCATFNLEGSEDERFFRGRWEQHGAGEQCETIIYDLDADETKIPVRF